MDPALNVKVQNGREKKMNEKLKQQLSLLLVLPENLVTILLEKKTPSEIESKLQFENRSTLLHLLFTMEEKGLLRSKMVITKKPTKFLKGSISRVFWASDICIQLEMKLKTFLLELDEK